MFYSSFNFFPSSLLPRQLIRGQMSSIYLELCKVVLIRCLGEAFCSLLSWFSLLPALECIQSNSFFGFYIIIYFFGWIPWPSEIYVSKVWWRGICLGMYHSLFLNKLISGPQWEWWDLSLPGLSSWKITELILFVILLLWQLCYWWSCRRWKQGLILACCGSVSDSKCGWSATKWPHWKGFWVGWTAF